MYIRQQDLIILIAFYIIIIPIALISFHFYTKSSTSNKPYYFKVMTATAYCPEHCCNGKWKGVTAEGKAFECYSYNICAVDPKVIPLGSIIEYDGKKYIAADVGSAIKGNKIDILVKTHEESIIFGVKRNQKIKVFIK